MIFECKYDGLVLQLIVDDGIKSTIWVDRISQKEIEYYCDVNKIHFYYWTRDLELKDGKKGGD